MSPALLLAAANLITGPGAATAQAPPSPPRHLLAEAVSASSINLAWEPGSRGAPAVNYNVYRNGANIGSTSATSFLDTGLGAGTTYTYTVTGVDNKGREGKRSSEASATTFPDDSPPTTPTEVSATAVSSSQIDLSWSASSDAQSGVSEYRVYRDGSLVGRPGGTSYQDTGLSPETEYEYRVSAVNGAGLESTRSDPARATTPRAADSTPPTTPTEVSATAVSSSQIDLSWSASSDAQSGVSEYRVYRDGSLVAATEETSYADGSLTPETEYEYRVSAVNGAGLESARSEPATATTPRADDTTPPTKPQALQADALSARQVQLSWQPSTDPESGVDRYNVYRDGEAVASSTETSFVDGDLTPDTEYDYEVSAVNGDGLESDRSDRVEVRTPVETDDTPPSAPSALIANAASATRIDLAWLPAEDPESGIRGYRVYRGEVLLDEVTETTYADLSVQPGTTYSYQVSAVNGDGLEGTRSPVASTTTPVGEDITPPAPPTGLRVVTPR